MNGDYIFIGICAAVFVLALYRSNRGLPVVPSAIAPPSGFGGSFRSLNSEAESRAFERLGEQYVENRAKRLAAEIQGDLPSVPKGE